MPKVLLDHQLKRLSRASSVPSDHWVRSHDLGDQRGSRVQTFRRDLQHTTSKISNLDHRCNGAIVHELTYPESQILGGENPTQPFFLIDDQDTIRPFSSTQLTSI